MHVIGYMQNICKAFQAGYKNLTDKRSYEKMVMYNNMFYKELITYTFVMGWHELYFGKRVYMLVIFGKVAGDIS